MPGLVPGIHDFLPEAQDVDGRNEPGHDESKIWSSQTSGCDIDTGRRSSFGRTDDDLDMLTEHRERLHEALK
jgi:hypothetical protein